MRAGIFSLDSTNMIFTSRRAHLAKRGAISAKILSGGKKRKGNVAASTAFRGSRKFGVQPSCATKPKGSPKQYFEMTSAVKQLYAVVISRGALSRRPGTRSVSGLTDHPHHEIKAEKGSRWLECGLNETVLTKTNYFLA